MKRQPPNEIAPHLLEEYLRTGEEYLLANADADDLRRALMLAADRIRSDPGPRSPLMVGARRLVAEVWRLVEDRQIDARSPAGDAALDLRDTIDASWWPRPEDERPDPAR